MQLWCLVSALCGRTQPSLGLPSWSFLGSSLECFVSFFGSLLSNLERRTPCINNDDVITTLNKCKYLVCKYTSWQQIKEQEETLPYCSIKSCS